MGEVMTNTGSTVQEYGVFYKVIVQSVLLYGSESWVRTGSMIKVFYVFHHRADIQISGMMVQYTTGGEWE